MFRLVLLFMYVLSMKHNYCNYIEHLKNVLIQYCYNLNIFFNNYIKNVNYKKLIFTKMLYL